MHQATGSSTGRSPLLLTRVLGSWVPASASPCQFIEKHPIWVANKVPRQGWTMVFIS